jgi:oxalate decarboxylase/phosphoglucose isomerase-like protein (cupin superfamily)
MRPILFFAPFAILFAQNRSVPVDDEFVRVLSVVDQPVAKPGALHEHKDNRLMIYLDSGDIRIEYANGKVDNQHWKAGDVAWSPANGMHTSQNVSANPVRIIEIEFHSKGVPATRALSGKALLENNQVRVYRNAGPIHSKNYVTIDEKTAEVLRNRIPAGPGPFLIAEIK